MNKTIKILMMMFVITIGFTLLGCNNDSGPATDDFTVSFVDYDGTVLKTIDCTVGETCDIVPPSDPDNKENAYFTRWSIFESQFQDIDRDTEIKAIYTLDNRVVTIGDRSIVFYSFFIITGIMVALLLGLRETDRTGIKRDDLIDGFLWIVPVAILGARLWYVAFEIDNFVYGGFFPSLLRILGFSSGTLDFSSFGLSGLAIHGAFVTAIICAYFYTRKRKIDIFKIIDIVAVGFIIAQAFGRWGNFFNQEAHGGIVGGMTNGVANLSIEEQYNFLRYTLHLPEYIVNNMYIVRGLHSLSVEPLTGFYHPTFFYESSINVIGFGIMLLLRRWKKIHFGELLSFYLIWYGGLRIFIETMRTDPLTFQLLGITFKSAIVTSVLMILAGLALSLFIRWKRKGMTYGTVPGYFGYKKTLNEEA
ncbi:MAG: prolipoprotein diacylglyceryl transferase [Bacilli bacterium]|nr:prolipoprotein diacylglyceryl transferase [Bacilli bacterium]